MSALSKLLKIETRLQPLQQLDSALTAAAFLATTCGRCMPSSWLLERRASTTTLHQTPQHGAAEHLDSRSAMGVAFEGRPDSPRSRPLSASGDLGKLGLQGCLQPGSMWQCYPGNGRKIKLLSQPFLQATDPPIESWRQTDSRLRLLPHTVTLMRSVCVARGDCDRTSASRAAHLRTHQLQRVLRVHNRVA